MPSPKRLERQPIFPPPGPWKYLNPIFERCTGCRLCEYACVKYHYGNVVNPELSRVRVHLMYPGPMAIPIQCSSCRDHPCTEACPVKPQVIVYDEEKFIIKVDKDRCLGHKCGKCAETCRKARSGAIHFYPPDHDYAIVCDQCDGAGPNGEPDPQCARICRFNVFYYASPAGGENGRYAWPAEAIAQDLAERYKPGTARKKVAILPPDL
jgi:Fe-S-cluster-containing hydrogenase component 2